MRDIDTCLRKTILTVDGGAVHDVIIIGAGPSGITAATLAFQRGLSVLLIEEAVLCSNVYNISEVEDVVFLREVPPMGKDVSPYFIQNIQRFQVDTVYERVVGMKLEGTLKSVITAEHVWWGRAIIIASGTKVKRRSIANSEQFYGRGVSYCAICDIGYFLGQPVMVVGAGEYLAKMALFMADDVSQVVVVNLSDRIQASAVIRTRLACHSRVVGYYGYKIVELLGKKKLEHVVLESLEGQKRVTIPCSALFIYEGLEANTDFLDKNQIELSEDGFVRTNVLMETTRSGVYAVGSVRDHPVKRIIYGMSDAMIAIDQIETYLYFL